MVGLFFIISSIPVVMLLSACQSIPPAPTEVRIPVPIACLERTQIPKQDFLTDTMLAQLDDFALVIELRSQQLKQRTWIAEAHALLEACAR